MDKKSKKKIFSYFKANLKTKITCEASLHSHWLAFKESCECSEQDFLSAAQEWDLTFVDEAVKFSTAEQILSFTKCVENIDPVSRESLELLHPEDAASVQELLEKKKITLSDGYTEATVAQQYFNSVSQFPLLSAEQERDLAERMEKGDKQARKTLLNSNLRLVISIAKRYQGRGLPLMDLIHEGNVGLAKGADKFDYRFGYKFSTYAHWWIQQSITRALADKGNIIRIPVHLFELRNKVLRKMQQYSNEDREIDVKEMAAELDTTVERVQSVLKIPGVNSSIDSSFGSGEQTVGEFLSKGSEMMENLLKGNSREMISKAFGMLPERECMVLRMRFGIEDSKPRTLDEIGIKLKVTRERVRQLQNRAIARLRSQLKQNMLKDLL